MESSDTCSNGSSKQVEEVDVGKTIILIIQANAVNYINVLEMLPCDIKFMLSNISKIWYNARNVAEI